MQRTDVADVVAGDEEGSEGHQHGLPAGNCQHFKHHVITDQHPRKSAPF